MLCPLLLVLCPCLIPLIYQGRRLSFCANFLSVMVPSLVQARKIGAAEVGIHPAAGLASLSDAAFDVNALDTGSGNMENKCAPSSCHDWRDYMVFSPRRFMNGRRDQANHPLSVDCKKAPEYDSVASIAERAFRHVVLDRYGDLNLKIDVLKACINCCEALPDFNGVLRFTVELLQTIRGDLMLGDAYRCPAVSSARRTNPPFE